MDSKSLLEIVIDLSLKDKGWSFWEFQELKLFSGELV